MTFALGAATSIGPGAQVKYKMSGGLPRIAAPLSGWGVAEGTLVAFGEAAGAAPVGPQPPNGAKPER